MELSAEVQLVRVPRVRGCDTGGETSLSLLDWGGEGPAILLAHGNGFCGALFEPVARALRSDFHVLGFDQRGHGHSAPADPDRLGWRVFRDDLAALIETLHRRGSIAEPPFVIGHSLGGTSALCAAAVRPDLFARILLLDPVTIAPEVIHSPERAENKGQLSAQARRRRSVWPSRAAALERWRSQGPLADWDPDVRELYVMEGLRDRPDGSVELACAPQIEAGIYEMTDYPDLRQVVAKLETHTLWVFASAGNFDAAWVHTLAASSDAIALETIDAGHLFPMEHPEAVVQRARRFFGRDEPGA